VFVCILLPPCASRRPLLLHWLLLWRACGTLAFTCLCLEARQHIRYGLVVCSVCYALFVYSRRLLLSLSLLPV